MTRLVGLIVVLSFVVGLLGACAAAPEQKSAPALGQEAAAPRPVGTAAPAAAAKAAESAPGARTDSAASGSGPSAAPAAPWDRMVIRTANLSLVVRSVEEALGAIRDLTQANDGFVAKSQSQYKGDQMVATVTVQVPAKSFDSLIQQIRRLAVKVESEQTTSQDVTEEFVDLSAQLKNLQVTEASLLKLMDKAQRVEDILALQRELTNVRGQIERLQGRINYLQRRSDMSTLVVSLTPEALARDDEQTGVWQPLKTIEHAWKASLRVITAVAEVILAVVVFSWWLVPIVAGGVWLLRRGRARGPQAAAPATAQPPAQPPAGA